MTTSQTTPPPLPTLSPGDDDPQQPWYRGITPYMWLVLLIASLGWVFDVFEGQIFVASMNEAMPSLLPPGIDEGTVALYNNIAFAAFLVGGAAGGVLFGMIGDRIGRAKAMILTILVYSLFTCVSAFAQNWWQLAGLRFLVALGTGGEWAVASAMIAEVFPNRARAHVGAIFHGSSVLGTFLAIIVGALVVGNEALGENAWRWGFALGALPALLTIWIRMKMREPEQWVKAKEREAAGIETPKAGRLGDIFRGQLLARTLLGVTLATVGIVTFWGVHIYGKNLMLQDAEQSYLAQADVQTPEAREAVLEEHRGELKDAEMLGMFLTTIGGGLGLLAFGPITSRIGRRPAFLLFHLGGFAMGLALFYFIPDPSKWMLFVGLPIFGFWTLGMHAGYAIYFPELYPTRVRGTGAGFCFNVARFATAPMLILVGWMRSPEDTGGLGMGLNDMVSILSLLFLLGAILLIFAPETRGRALPE